MSRLLKKKTFVMEHQKEISEGQLNSMLFDRKNNGLSASGAVIKRGRAIWIDEDPFFDWMRSMKEVA